jgi:hypothetical protein
MILHLEFWDREPQKAVNSWGTIVFEWDSQINST